VEPTAAVADDPLRHYSALVVKGNRLVAGNGRHVSELFATEHGPEAVRNDLLRLEHEPDAPIYTPRIAIITDTGEGSVLATIGLAARKPTGGTTHCIRAVSGLNPGEAWIAHTYAGDAAMPDPSGFVAKVEFAASAEQTNARIWDTLDARYRVAVATVAIHSSEQWAMGEWDVAQRSDRQGRVGTSSLAGSTHKS
jgi:IMP cyclohydrolase